MWSNANFYKQLEEGSFGKTTLANNVALSSKAENEPFPIPWTLCTT